MKRLSSGPTTVLVTTKAAFAPSGYEVLDARDYGAARVHFLRFVGV